MDDNTKGTSESNYNNQCLKTSNNCGKTVINEKSDGTLSILMCPTRNENCVFRSCNEIKEFYPLAISGYYNIVTNDGNTINVYCYMEGDNCNINGLTDHVWTRIVHFDMSEPNAVCPNELRTHQFSNIDHPVCRQQFKAANFGGCVSILLVPSNGQTFSNVCGRMRGYQYYTPDAFFHDTNNDINQQYLNGYSITYGSPRNHIWSYAAGLEQTNVFFPNPNGICSCADRTDIIDPPSFVGSDYYCESGLPIGQSWQPILYADDPLWDGNNCNGEESPCCNPSNMPWFSKHLGNSTNDDIEVRLCLNHGISGEEIPFDILELFTN